jgi:hypothetical protein
LRRRLTTGEASWSAVCRLPSAVCRLPSAVCRLPSAVCRLPSAVCRLPSAAFGPEGLKAGVPFSTMAPPLTIPRQHRPREREDTAEHCVHDRSWTRGWILVVVQFLKSRKRNAGDRKLASHLRIEWHAMGEDAVAAPPATPDRAPNNAPERRPSPSNQQRRTAPRDRARQPLTFRRCGHRVRVPDPPRMGTLRKLATLRSDGIRPTGRQTGGP